MFRFNTLSKTNFKTKLLIEEIINKNRNKNDAISNNIMDVSKARQTHANFAIQELS